MAFPQDQLDVRSEILINGSWVSVVEATGSRTRLATPITVRTGTSAWGSRPGTGKASYVLDNHDGRWSPDNTSSIHYPYFKRNIPVRIGFNRFAAYATPNGGSGNDIISTPDTAALNVTGDIDVRCWFQLHEDLIDTLEGGNAYQLGFKRLGSSGWNWYIYDENDAIHMAVVLTYNDGTTNQNIAVTTIDAGGEVPWWANHDAVAMRWTVDVSTNTLRFYYGSSINGSYTEIGSGVVLGTVSSLVPSTSSLRVAGGGIGVFVVPLKGRMFQFQMRDGIDGTIVADCDILNQTHGTTSFTGDAGLTWTVGADGEISQTRWRFHGEIASIAPKWDKADTNRTCEIEAQGLFRRLRQGNRRLSSAFRRAVLIDNDSTGTVLNYWPMEESGQNLQRFGAAIGTNAVVITNGNPTAATNSTIEGSDNLSTPGDSVWTATVDTYTATDAWDLQWLQVCPADYTGTDIVYLRVETSSLDWEVWYRDTSGGQLQVKAYPSGSGTPSYTSAWTSMDVTGAAYLMRFAVEDNGANVDFTLTARPPGGSAGGIADTAVAAGAAGQAQTIIVNRDSNIDPWAIGHMFIRSVERSDSFVADALDGHSGEAAARRVQRLCREEGILSRIEGDPDTSEAMGPQRPNSLIGLLEECATTDLGKLYEARESLAVHYRTRVATTGQGSRFTGNYAEGGITLGPPVYDDQGFANDITAKNLSGTEARSVLDDGSDLSVSEPPTGAGRYENTVTVNADDETRLPLIANGYLAVSTSQPRHPGMSFHLERPYFANSDVLYAGVINLLHGDRIQVINPTSHALAATVDQIVDGATEVLGPYEHRVDVVTVPAAPFTTDPYA